MRQRIPMKSKTLPPAASGCRRGAGKPAARRAGQRSFLCCSRFSVALVGARSEVVRFFPQGSVVVRRRWAAGQSAQPGIRKHADLEGSSGSLSSSLSKAPIVSVSNGPSGGARLRFRRATPPGRRSAGPAMPGRGIVGPGEARFPHTLCLTARQCGQIAMVRFVNAQDATPAAK